VKVLSIDVGGTHVKVLASDEPEPRNFDSAPTLTPSHMVNREGAHPKLVVRGRFDRLPFRRSGEYAPAHTGYQGRSVKSP
jgi:hypothetical protein